MNASTGQIVVGIDGSDASIEALRWALAQAGLTGGDVVAVTSWQRPKEYGGQFVAEEVDWEKLAQTILDDALQAVDPGEVTIHEHVCEGHPAQVLIDASQDAALLVVGSRGHGGFVGLLIGSVSAYVSAHAHCPVVVVRNNA
ncbi:MAG: universal stress protein [Propionibacteriaceae bacterium]